MTNEDTNKLKIRLSQLIEDIILSSCFWKLKTIKDGEYVKFLDT